MSVDPATTKLSSVSPYAYAANNPIIYKDPDEREIIIYYMRNGENKNMFTIQVFLFLLLKKAREEKAAVDDTNIINSILDEETKSSRGGKNAKC